jgi:hypothetical protein
MPRSVIGNLTAASPTGESPTAKTSISDISGIIALGVGIPGAVAAVIGLLHYVRQRRRSLTSKPGSLPSNYSVRLVVTFMFRLV